MSEELDKILCQCKACKLTMNEDEAKNIEDQLINYITTNKEQLKTEDFLQFRNCYSRYLTMIKKKLVPYTERTDYIARYMINAYETFNGYEDRIL